MRRSGVGACALIATACGCTPEPPQLPDPLPPLRVEQVVVSPPVVSADHPAGLPQEAPVTEKRITFTASNAQVRDILPMIAEAAGVTLLLHPTVDGRVSFHFEDVPALDALRAVARQAGLELAVPTEGMQIAFAPRTVFYLTGANVNVLDAESLMARFRISREMAEFIVLSRIARVR